MKTLAFVFMLLFGLLNLVLAQPSQLLNTNYQYMQPAYNTGVSSSSTLASTGDLASDGKGHHYVLKNANGQITHYLFDNIGTLLHTASFGSTFSTNPCITTRNGRAHVVLHETALNRVQLWRSVDGGATWTNVDFRPVAGNLNGLDSFEDDRGVHIVYSSDGEGGGIFYHLKNQADLWSPFSTTVYGTPVTNAQPSVTTSTVAQGDSAHILSLQGLFSFKFPSSGAGQWASRISPVASPNKGAIAVVPSITSSTFAPYMFLVAQPGSETALRRANRTYDSQDAWSTYTPISGTVNSKVSVATTPSFLSDFTWPNFVWSDYQLRYRIMLNRFRPANSDVPMTFGPHEVSQVSPGVYRDGSSPVVGSNQGTLTVIWRDHTDNTLYFRRKPFAILGDMNENYVLTDTNWILSTTILASGKELRLKSGSVTYLWGQWTQPQLGVKGPGKLVVSEGASIVIESGARLICSHPPVAEIWLVGQSISAITWQ
ncbi:MAG: hypothetical protein ACKVRP_06220 [Bacteroidota bacterium]